MLPMIDASFRQLYYDRIVLQHCKFALSHEQALAPQGPGAIGP